MEKPLSDFCPPKYLSSPHTQTIIPALFRTKLTTPHFNSILELPDGDFLETRWHRPSDNRTSNNPLVIITHGLEGSMDSPYVRGLAKTLYDSNIASLTWNMRGCGRRQNRLKTWYHSGSSSDLRAIVTYARQELPLKPIFIVGISIGGNITAKYLGEEAANAREQNIIGAAIVSTPLDLEGSAKTLALPSRRLYMQHLLRSLRRRIFDKHAQFGDEIPINQLRGVRTFYDFDRIYTAPLNGFASVQEYWKTCSGINFLSTIDTPTLILTALDDPFLSSSCIPNKNIHLPAQLFIETPSRGGHVGFIDSLCFTPTWLERRLLKFISENR